MNFTQFCAYVADEFDTDSRGQRFGQFMMNQLQGISPQLYEAIPGNVDCFYSDKLVSSCFAWLGENWDKYSF